MRRDGAEPNGGAGPPIDHRRSGRRRGAAVLLTLYTALCLALLVPGIMTAVTSLMLFDAPGSRGSALTIALVLGGLSTPVLLVASPTIAWVAFAMGRDQAARRAVLLIPLGWLAYMAAAVALIATACGGRLEC